MLHSYEHSRPRTSTRVFVRALASSDGCTRVGMSFIDKVGELRRLLGIDSSLELPPAIAAMNAAMGVTAEGALLAQIDGSV